jgi:hypothetical protein
MNTIRHSIRAALLGASALAVSIGWAQQPERTTPETYPPAQAQERNTGSMAIDERKLDQFADAYVAVQKIQADSAAELDSAAGDPAKQQQTQQKVENEMIAAVERTGLKLEEFNGIVQTMQADADLRARIAAKIRQRMGG